MYIIEKLDKNTEDVKQYIESSKEKSPQFIERYDSYELDNEIRAKLKCHSEKYSIYGFSAEWCKDCYKHIPVLAHIQDQTGIKTRIFGQIMRDAKNPHKRWRIPPSPEEVELFEVEKLPSIYVIDNHGNKMGEIIENPPEGKNLERAILDILES
jgi:thiol-disulfide isomerase/thioredoxin